MGRSTKKETGLSEQRKYRGWTAKQKLGIVLAGLKGDRSGRDVRREQGISETLYQVNRKRATSVWVAERGWCYFERRDRLLHR